MVTGTNLIGNKVVITLLWHLAKYVDSTSLFEKTGDYCKSLFSMVVV